MHYLFKDEKSVRAFLYNVTCKLEPGGYFLGTTIDADRLIALIRSKGADTMRIENQYFSVQLG